MNILRLGLFFLGVVGTLLTLVWAFMWMIGLMSGYVPLYSFVGTAAVAFTFFASFGFTGARDD